MASSKRPLKYPHLSPRLQISFYYRLQSLRATCLFEALAAAVERIDVALIDHELQKYVDGDSLQIVASFGLRGELFFPVPCVLSANPFLLGYYRLLLGLSQKEFYSKGPFGRFKRLEVHGEIPESLSAEIAPLCRSLCESSRELAGGVDELSKSVIHDLQLLTLGPQLRGGENTRIGQDATKTVFQLIRSLVEPYIRETTTRTIRVKNASGRTVMIEFLADPDVRITEKLPSGIRPLVSVEIKGGADASNIHNRLGEAEKSHQKAKKLGFFEFWTIARVDIAEDQARRESPTTTHFFQLERIARAGTPERKQFAELLASLIGIRLRRR